MIVIKSKQRQRQRQHWRRLQRLSAASTATARSFLKSETEAIRTTEWCTFRSMLLLNVVVIIIVINIIDGRGGGGCTLVGQRSTGRRFTTQIFPALFFRILSLFRIHITLPHFTVKRPLPPTHSLSICTVSSLFSLPFFLSIFFFSCRSFSHSRTQFSFFSSFSVTPLLNHHTPYTTIGWLLYCVLSHANYFLDTQ